jgi:hypothetical protein
MPKTKIKRRRLNAIKCGECDEIIVSLYRHDFFTCSCGATSVDGGDDYQRVVHKSKWEPVEVWRSV